MSRKISIVRSFVRTCLTSIPGNYATRDHTPGSGTCFHGTITVVLPLPPMVSRPRRAGISQPGPDRPRTRRYARRQRPLASAAAMDENASARGSPRPPCLPLSVAPTVTAAQREPHGEAPQACRPCERHCCNVSAFSRERDGREPVGARTPLLCYSSSGSHDATRREQR